MLDLRKLKAAPGQVCLSNQFGCAMCMLYRGLQRSLDIFEYICHSDIDIILFPFTS